MTKSFLPTTMPLDRIGDFTTSMLTWEPVLELEANQRGCASTEGVACDDQLVVLAVQGLGHARPYPLTSRLVPVPSRMCCKCPCLFDQPE